MKSKRFIILIICFSMFIPFFNVKRSEAVLPLIAGVSIAELVTDLCISLGATYLTYEVVSNASYKNAVKEEVEKHLNSNDCEIIQFKKPNNPKNEKNDFDKDKFNRLMNGSIADLLIKEQNNIKSVDNNNKSLDYTKESISGLYYSDLVSAICCSVLSSDSVINCAKSLNSESKNLLDLYKPLNNSSNIYSRMNIVSNFDNITNSVMYYKCLDFMNNLSMYNSKYYNVNANEYNLIMVSNYYNNFNNEPSELNYTFVFQKKPKYCDYRILNVLRYKNSENSELSYDWGLTYSIAPKEVNIPNIYLTYYNSNDKNFDNEEKCIKSYYGKYVHVRNEFENMYGNDKPYSNMIIIGAKYSNTSNYGDNYTFDLKNYSHVFGDHRLGVGGYGNTKNNVQIYIKQNSEFLYQERYYYKNGKMYELNEFWNEYDLINNITDDKLLFDLNNMNKVYYNNNDNEYNVPDRVKEADDQARKKRKSEVSQNNIIEYPYYDYTTINNNTKKVIEMPEHSVNNDADDYIDDDRESIIEPAHEVLTVGDPLVDENDDRYIKPVDPEGNPIEYPESQTEPDPDPDPDSKPTPSIDPNNNNNSGTIAPDLRDYFPFCLPFDLVKFLELFNSNAKAPEFELKFNNPFTNQNYKIDINLEDWSPVASVFRFLIIILFCLALIKWTSNIMGGGRD